MITLFTAAVMLFTACKPKDPAIAEAVKAKISAIAQGIGVDVQKGVVTLSGEVKDEATKAAVEAALKGVKGVKSIVNNITIPPPVVINPDDTLKTLVNAALEATGIKGIKADISNGEVTLTGDVKKADLIKVMQAANEAKPKKVINNLNILK